MESELLVLSCLVGEVNLSLPPKSMEEKKNNICLVFPVHAQILCNLVSHTHKSHIYIYILTNGTY